MGLNRLPAYISLLSLAAVCLESAVAQHQFRVLRQIGDLKHPEACEAPHSLFQTRDGVLFGLANLGPAGRPAIFRLSPDGWVLRVVRELEAGTRLGNTQGLSEGTDGSLYGVALSGGEFGKGYLFRIDQGGTGYQILHHFRGPDGEWPNSRVVEGNDGFLYGLTARGGTNWSLVHSTDSNGDSRLTTNFSNGVLYRVDRQGDQFAVVHHFPNEALWTRDLVRAPDATILLSDSHYTDGSVGAIYRLETQTGALSLIHNFPADLSEGFPTGHLQSHPNGYVFGLADYSLFRMRPDGSDFKVIKRFSPEEGKPTNPNSNLRTWHAHAPNVLLVERHEPDSRLWGMFAVSAYTGIGDPVDLARVFRIDPEGSSYELFDYEPITYQPVAHIDGTGPPFTAGNDGWIYGVSRGPTRIASADVVSRMTPDARRREVVYRFSRLRSDYDAPSAISSDGTLYGSVLEPTATNSFRVRAFVRRPPIYETETLFSSAQGEPFLGPFKALLEGADGDLYFIDEGRNGYGAHVSMASKDGAIRNRAFYLTYIASGWFQLVESADGFLYGSAVDQPKQTRSFVFRCRAGLTDFKELAGWNRVVEGAPDPTRPALVPKGSLVEGSDGSLYIFSDTQSIHGSALRRVELYRISKDGASVRRTELDRNFGYFPHGTVIEGSDKALYYVTGQKLCRMDKDAAGPQVVWALDETMQGDEDGEFLVRGEPGTLYAASSGWESSSGYFLRIMELEEKGDARLIYQSSTTEPPSALSLRALRYVGNRRLLGIAESQGGTNGWGLVFELIPGGTNHPPRVVRRMDSQVGMVGQRFVVDISESLFADPDPGQSLRITVEPILSALPRGVVFDPTTRQLIGTPQSSGLVSVMVRATDDGTPPLTASLSFELNVQPALRFIRGSSRSSADRFQALIHGPAGRRTQLEVSSDLATWTPVQLVELNGEWQTIGDEPAGVRPVQRFYRLRLMP